MFVTQSPTARQAAGFPNAAVFYAGLVPPSVPGGAGVGSVVVREIIQLYGTAADDTSNLLGVVDDEDT